MRLCDPARRDARASHNVRKERSTEHMTHRYMLAGSFDPFTIGHADLVRRALALCDELVIAVGYNERKVGWIPVDERVRALSKFYAAQPQVLVAKYSCLTVDFAKQQGVTCLLRGVRSVSDYDYEMQMADVNRELAGLDTLLLPAAPGLGHVSSSMVRELVHFGKDITPYLPQGLQYII